MKKTYTKSKASFLVAEARPQWILSKRLKPSKGPAVLSYEGKISESQVHLFAPDCSFSEIGAYGQTAINQAANLLILGDNLSALRFLLEHSGVAGKIRLVYIDPPFATDQEFRTGERRTSTISSSSSDSVAYEDRLIGKDFLEYLRHRLILLREIMSPDASIYLHIDCKIGHYVKIIMDEVFGQDNFINDIARIKCNPKNFSRRGFGNIRDMILFYSKSKDFIWNEPRAELSEEDIIRLFPKVDAAGRRYTTNPLHAPGETLNGATGKEWNGLFPPVGRHWRIPPSELNKLDKQGLIEWSSSGNPRKKIYAEDVLKRGKKVQDVWPLKDPQYPNYPTEKNLQMLERIVSASSNPGDLVLDCFCGSGTTLIAAESLGRQWIGIDSSKPAIDGTMKRLNQLQNVSFYMLYKCVHNGKKK